MKPDSSRKAMLAFRRVPLFYAGPILLSPSLNRVVVFLAGLVFWHLARPAELMVKNSPNVVGMILHAERPLDHFPYPSTGPQLVPIA
jgi:hypothetical protein